MARDNQISNAVGTGLKAHSGGPEAHHYNAEFGCREENQSCSEGYPELIYSFMDVLAWATFPTYLQIMFLIQEDLTSSSSSLNDLAFRKCHLP